MFHLEEEDNRRPFSFKYGFQKHYFTKITANHVFFPLTRQKNHALKMYWFASLFLGDAYHDFTRILAWVVLFLFCLLITIAWQGR